jgi:hypothetical protein
MRTILLLSTLSLIALVPASAAAQRRFVGTVTDSASGAAVAGASVRLATAREEEETDATGFFEIVAERGAADTLVVHRIGYRDARVTVEMIARERDADSIHIRLQPDPVMLAALRAVGRAGPLMPPWGRRDCGDCGGSGYPPIRGFGVVQLLEDRFGYRREACPDSLAQPQPYCSMLRGRVEPVELYVDGIRATGGLDDAARYPLASVYSITISRDRRVVFLVTNREMERAAWEYLRASGRFP